MAAYLALPSVLNSMRARRHLFTMRDIAGSGYSKAGTRWHVRGGHKTLAEMMRRIARFARGAGRGYAWAYWPKYDSLCHEFGVAHARTTAHLDGIDRALAALVRVLSGTDACLLVTADHGLMGTPRGHSIDLAGIPGFYDCLATLPAGDRRAVFCFVRPAKVGRFLRIVRTRLSRVCVCVPGETLLRMKAFGTGGRHPSLEGRVADFVLLGRPGCAMDSSVFGCRRHPHLGNHGGMSEEEMLVPLYALDMMRDRP